MKPRIPDFQREARNSRRLVGLLLVLAAGMLAVVTGAAQGWRQWIETGQAGAVAAGHILAERRTADGSSLLVYEYQIYTLDRQAHIYTGTMPMPLPNVGLPGWQAGSPVEVRYWPDDPRVAYVGEGLPATLPGPTVLVSVLLTVGVLLLIRG